MNFATLFFALAAATYRWAVSELDKTENPKIKAAAPLVKVVLKMLMDFINLEVMDSTQRAIVEKREGVILDPDRLAKLREFSERNEVDLSNPESFADALRRVDERSAIVNKINQDKAAEEANEGKIVKIAKNIDKKIRKK